MTEELATHFKSQPRDVWLEALIAAGIPSGPVYDYSEIVADEQFWQNGYLQEISHPGFEDHAGVGIPVSFSETPVRVEASAPELGLHTEEVLLELGYDWSDIERFHDAGVTSPQGD